MTIGEHSNMSTLSRLMAASVGDLQIETRISACFSEQSGVIHLTWSEHDARAAVRRGELLVGAPVALLTARAWIHEACEALLEPEREVGGRSTTEHAGALTWNGHDAEGQFGGRVTWQSRDADPEMVALVHDRRPQIAEMARRSYVVAFAMEELATQMGSVADALLGKRGWVEQAESFLPYLSQHANTQPLFVPELEAAERIVALMRKEPRSATDAEQIVRTLGAVDQQPHYDGCGWRRFRGVVRWWLEERGSAS